MLRSIDYAIVAVYFVITLGIGFWSARRSRESARGFFVAERSLPWWVVGFTMVAASISAEQMLGEVGAGLDGGLVVSNWELAVFPALALMLFVFLPVYLRTGVQTIPEYLERRYGRQTRFLFAGYTVFNNACVVLPMVIALGVTALKYFLGLPPLWGALLLCAFTGLYTVYGGMSSVAWTDTFQCVLLLAGGLLVFILGLMRVPDGWSGLIDRMPDPHLVRGLDDAWLPWTGLLLLALSTNVWYCCTNQAYVQACLGARSTWHGRMGVLLTAFLGPVLTLCFAAPGYITRDLLNLGQMSPIPPGADGLPDANAAYPHLVSQLLGPGLRGFMVAAVLGAIMSTVSALVQATATVWTIDLYQRWLRPQADDRHLVRVGQWSGLATLSLALPLSLLAANYRYIFFYSQNAWCILAIPIMLVFTLGVLWRRATNQAAIATFLLVAPFVALSFVLQDRSRFVLPLIGREVHLFTFAFGLWIVAAAFMIVVSLLTPRPDPAAIEPYIWRPGRPDPSLQDRTRPLYQRVGWWSIVAGLVYVVIYVRYF